MADNIGSPLDSGPFGNTNIMDRDAMSSPNAEMARQKSQEVMAALKKNDGSADRMMGNTRPEKESSGGGFRNWIKRKMGPGSGEGHSSKPEKTRGRKSEDTGGIEGLKGNSNGLGVEDSSAGIVIGDSAPKGDILARDGGKGDGVIR